MSLLEGFSQMHIAYGSVNITNTGNAEDTISVYIDNKRIGEDILFIENVFIGTYNIKVVQEEDNPFILYSRNLKIEENEDEDIEIIVETVNILKLFKFPIMVLVEGSTFIMGSNDGNYDERPVHEVTVSSFYMSKYEVTFEQYNEFCESTDRWKPYDYGWGREFKPVIKVTWYDAVDYCDWLSEKEGLTPCYRGNGENITCNFDANGYRLPTEAEWEYAAKGGINKDIYKYVGSDYLNRVAWNSSNSGSETHPVGRLAPNSLGIYDMSGNVWEWCWDWYGSDYYNKAYRMDPEGPSRGDFRVLRGGSWNLNTTYMRCASRFGLNPVTSYVSSGFRVVVSSF